MTPAERFDKFRFNVDWGQKYRKQVVTYRIPFSGDQKASSIGSIHENYMDTGSERIEGRNSIRSHQLE